VNRSSRCSLCLLVLLSAACLSPKERQAALFAQADGAAKAGDLPRAIAKLRAAVGYDPSDVEAVTRLADLLVRANLGHEAERLLDEFPADAQRDGSFRNLRVRLLTRSGRVAQALPILLALDQHGGAEPATVLAAIEAWAAKGTTPAEAPGLPNDWRLALAGRILDGKNAGLAAVWLRTLPGESAQEEDLTDRLLVEVLRSEGTALSESVVALAESGDTANKSLVLRRHLTTNKNWAEVSRVEERFLAEHIGHSSWTEVALATAWRALRAGEHRAAERLANQVAAIDPVSVEPLVVRGLALRGRGLEVEARKALELALALDPKNATARMALSGSERNQDAIQIDLNLRGARPESR